jgi:hypothetical protein
MSTQDEPRKQKVTCHQYSTAGKPERGCVLSSTYCKKIRMNACNVIDSGQKEDNQNKTNGIKSIYLISLIMLNT